MALSQSKLAEELNALVKAGRVAISETRESIAINQMSGAEAARIYELLIEAGWSEVAAEDDGGEIPRHHLERSSEGIRVRATRPQMPEGTDGAITLAGFASLLERAPSSSVVWIEGLTASIDTRTVRYAPWGNDDVFVPFPASPNPAKVIRNLGKIVIREDLGRWILRESVDIPLDEYASLWIGHATPILLRAIAQEIEPDEKLLFRGPPSVRFSIASVEKITKEHFKHIEELASWVFNNDRELENRHGLMSAEIARLASRGGDARDLASVLAPALEGAKIAYNFGITQQSKDTLKSLGDLRKSISDDTSKISETIRSLAGAIVGAIFGGIGLIATRGAVSHDNNYIEFISISIGIVLSAYVYTVIGIGIHFISVQGDLRKEWKSRLYRFLSDDDYDRLVSKPATRAERAFWCVALIGVVLTIVLMIVILRMARFL